MLHTELPRREPGSFPSELIRKTLLAAAAWFANCNCMASNMPLTGLDLGAGKSLYVSDILIVLPHCSFAT